MAVDRTGVTDNRELMRFHVEAEFSHDSAGQLVRVNEPNGGLAPRFFLGLTSDGPVWWFRHDVEDDARSDLEAAIRADALTEVALDSPMSPARYHEILARSAAIQHTWLGPAFAFPADLPRTDAILVTPDNARVLEPLLAPWLPDVTASAPLFAATVDGQAVSVCGSVRRTDFAHEAGVETVPDYRGRGYAAHVVTAWARAVREMGRVPLYSTSWKNEASRAVARKLGLIQFGNDLHVT